MESLLQKLIPGTKRAEKGLCNHDDARRRVCLICFRKVSREMTRTNRCNISTKTQHTIAALWQEYDAKDLRLPCKLVMITFWSLRFWSITFRLNTCLFLMHLLEGQSVSLACPILHWHAEIDSFTPYLGSICNGCRSLLRKDPERVQQRLQLVTFYISNSCPEISSSGHCPCRLCDLANESAKDREKRLRFNPYPTAERKPANTIEKKTAARFTYSHQQVDRLKRKNSLSDKTTLSLLCELRRASGDRFLIEPNYKEHCTKRNQILKDFFEVSELQGSMGVVCRDTSLLIEKFMNARGVSKYDVLL